MGFLSKNFTVIHRLGVGRGQEPGQPRRKANSDERSKCQNQALLAQDQKMSKGAAAEASLSENFTNALDAMSRKRIAPAKFKEIQLVGDHGMQCACFKAGRPSRPIEKL